jgi:hypothetical protein
MSLLKINADSQYITIYMAANMLPQHITNIIMPFFSSINKWNAQVKLLLLYYQFLSHFHRFNK